MKADLVLVISPEAPLMKQLGKALGKLCTMYDFTTIDKNEKVYHHTARQNWACSGLYE